MQHPAITKLQLLCPYITCVRSQHLWVLVLDIHQQLVSYEFPCQTSESLQHCIRPQNSITSLYGRFRAQKQGSYRAQKSNAV